VVLDPQVSIFEVDWSPVHAGGADRGARPRTELAWAFLGTAPYSEIEERDASDQLTGKRFDLINPNDAPFTVSLGAEFEPHRSYDVLGPSLLFTYNVHSGSPWNLEWLVDISRARYQSETGSTWAWRGSIRSGIGYAILFFEAGAERDLAIDRSGHSHREWRYFAGPRLRLSTSWITSLISHIRVWKPQE
jgi:hypothetical protein